MLDMIHDHHKFYPDEVDKHTDICDYIAKWDIRIPDTPDDHRFDYGDSLFEDDNRFVYDYNQDGSAVSPVLVDVEGGEDTESEHPEFDTDYEFLDLSVYDPDIYNADVLVDLDGGEDIEVDADAFDFPEADGEPAGPEYDFNELAEENPNEDSGYYDLNTSSSSHTEDYTEDFDFNQLAYGAKDEDVNIMAVITWQIAKILQDEIIKIKSDYLADYRIYKLAEPAADANVKIHFGLNTRLHKVYVEWLFNARLNDALGEYRQRVNNILINRLHTFINMTHRHHKWSIELVLPEDHETFVCDTSQILTPHTIGYWKSFEGHYAFLEDREMVKHDMLSLQILAKREHKIYDKSEFYRRVHQINLEYGMNATSHNRIPEVFEKYRELYKELFNVDLPVIYECNVWAAIHYNLYGEYKNSYEMDIDIGENEVA